MRIAYLNPWRDGAENRSYFSLAAAGSRLGHELIDCGDCEEIERTCPDFVLSVTPNIPKGTDFPSYLLVQQPPAMFLEHPPLLRNLLTYDGFLTISGSLQRFLEDLGFGVGHPEKPGFFCLSAPLSDVVTDLGQLIDKRQLRIVCYEIDRNGPVGDLFGILDGIDLIRIHAARGVIAGRRRPWPHDRNSVRCLGSPEGVCRMRAGAGNAAALRCA